MSATSSESGGQTFERIALPVARDADAAANVEGMAREAMRAMERRDYVEALRLWEKARYLSPRNAAGYVGAINALIGLNRLAEAEQLLDEASSLFVGEGRLQIAQARLAAARRDWGKALLLWEAIRARGPDDPAGYAGAGVALRELGRVDDAEVLLEPAVAKFRDHEALAIAYAALANVRRDWPAAVRRWEGVCVQFPDNLWAHLGSITALRGAGQPDELERRIAEAGTALARARQRGLGSEAAVRAGIKIAQAGQDWEAVRELTKGYATGDAGAGAEVFLACAQACLRLGDRDAADEAAVRALKEDAGLVDALLVRVQVATERGDAEVALSSYRKLADLNPGTTRWSFKVIELLNLLGRVKEAIGELEALTARRPNDPVVRLFSQNFAWTSQLATDDRPLPATNGDGSEPLAGPDLKALLDKAPQEAERRRGLIVVDPLSDVQIVEVKGATTIVLVFTGSNDMVSMPLPVFDRFLAPWNATVVYLKDFNRLRFLKGIRSLAEDYAGTIVALRDLLKRLGMEQLFVIGNCYGGFAAIRYGVELDAERIATFGAMTHIPSESAAKFEQTRNFMMKRLLSEVSPDMIDLKPFLKERPHGSQIDFFYDGDDRRDIAHAEQLAGLPGVRLHRRSAQSTSLLLRKIALASGDFSETLKRLLIDPDPVAVA